MGFVNDESHHPVLLTTWSGETTLPDVDAYNVWMDAHIEKARLGRYKIALISDAVAVTRTPPEVRGLPSDLRLPAEPL